MINGRQAASDNTFTNYTGVGGLFYVGDNETSGDANNSPFTGYLAELIVINSSLDATQRNQIESYLAIKYGKTLDNSAGGADGDYLSSAGATVWDASNGPAYHNQVIGIGRDDNAGLNQKQSRTSDDGTRLYLSTLQSTNAANTGNFGNGQHIMVGNNGAENYGTGGTEYPTGMNISSRINREWKITRTNNTATFSLDINIQANPITASHLRVLVDADGDFTNATMITPTLSVSGTRVTISGITSGMIPNNSTRYITLVSVNPVTTLPVNFLSFTGRRNNQDDVALNWTTAEEINNDYFNVERSASGSNWETIGKVTGVNRSGSHLYSFTDATPLQSLSYYRLKQVDFNGSARYSPVIKVYHRDGQRVKTWPNPAQSFVIAELPGMQVKDIRLFDASGRELTGGLSIQAMGTGRFHINVNSLPDGLYILKAGDITSRFVKGH